METKVTKIAVKNYVKHQLSCNEAWAIKGLLRIYDFQTSEEKLFENTHDYNGVGFTGVDGEILASFAKQYKRNNKLSIKQMNILYRKMPKYWNQIISISNEEKLREQVAKSLKTLNFA